MELRIMHAALREIAAMDAWWRANRLDAADLFDDELAEALDRMSARPHEVGVAYSGRAGYRRLLLPRTRKYVYFVPFDRYVEIAMVWGAPRLPPGLPRLRR